jgi:hypothetical protein
VSAADPDSQTIRDIPEQESVQSNPDSNANKENDAIISDAYAHDAKRQGHKRDQGIKNVGYYATATLIWGGVILISVTTGIWADHVLMPKQMRWLSPDEVNHVQSLLFSSALSAALTLLGKKIL